MQVDLDFAQAENIDDLNDLLELGWVQYYTNPSDPENKTQIYLHSLVAEMIALDLKPEIENCPSIHRYTRTLLRWFKDCDIKDTTFAMLDESEHKGRFLSEMFADLGIDKLPVLQLAVEWLQITHGKKYGQLARTVFATQITEQSKNLIRNTAYPYELRQALCIEMLDHWVHECIVATGVPTAEENAVFFFRMLANQLCSGKVSVLEKFECIISALDDYSKNKKMCDESGIQCDFEPPAIPKAIVQQFFKIYEGFVKIDTSTKEFYGVPLSSLEKGRRTQRLNRAQEKYWDDYDARSWAEFASGYMGEMSSGEHPDYDDSIY